MLNAEPWRRRGGALLATVGVIWIVSLYGLLVDQGLQFALAVLPRRVEGLAGVLGMPFVHGSMTHLLANTVPMLIFGGILVSRGIGYFFKVSLAIMVLGGAAPESIAHGVVEVADRQGGHGARIACSAVIAVNASDGHGV